MTASLIDVAGAAPVEDSEGRSLAQQVTGPEGRHEGKEVVFSKVSSHTMAFDGRYKLVVEAISDKPVELYDWESDPDEVNNRVDDPGLESIRQDLIENHLSRIRNRLDVSRLKAFEDTWTARNG